MISEAYINQVVKEIFEEVRFASDPSGLYDPLRYMLSIGGKRIRPKLCILAYSIFKDDLYDDIVEPALALEIFHSFTLLHDDIMDRSDLRRGQPTVWKKWGEDTAILSGDVMNIESFRRMSSVPEQYLGKVLPLFVATAAQVCEGQQYDMEFENEKQVSMGSYMKMIGLKTAVLLACCAKIGAIMGDASDLDADFMYEYGYQLGLAFQVADDYLDTYGDESVFGKPIGGDIVNNKKTWLLTRAQEKDEDRSELLEAMAMPVETAEQREAKIKAVKKIYNALGVDKDAREEISRLTTLAMESALKVNVSSVRIEMLRRFAESLVGRTL
jgi:geranylgeranyl diphosphate synthase, type II